MERRAHEGGDFKHSLCADRERAVEAAFNLCSHATYVAVIGVPVYPVHTRAYPRRARVQLERRPLTNPLQLAEQ